MNGYLISESQNKKIPWGDLFWPYDPEKLFNLAVNLDTLEKIKSPIESSSEVGVGFAGDLVGF